MIGIDTAITTLDAARDACPNPLDTITERQRIAAQQRLRQIDALRAELNARGHVWRAAELRLRTVDEEHAKMTARRTEVAAALDELGEVDGRDRSVEGTQRWRRRESLAYEQTQLAGLLVHLSDRRAAVAAQVAEAADQLRRVLDAVAALGSA